MDYVWLSRNSDTFSVDNPQLEMTCISGTFDSRLWVLGTRCNFPRLQVFFNSEQKYLTSFFSYQLSAF